MNLDFQLQKFLPLFRREYCSILFYCKKFKMAAFIATFEFCVFIMNDFVITLLHNANSLIFASKTIAYILKMTRYYRNGDLWNYILL